MGLCSGTLPSPPFPLYLNPYLLRSGHYCTHKVTQTPQGSLFKQQKTGLEGPINLRQTKSSALFTEHKTAQTLKVDKCNGCGGHCGQLNAQPKYLCSTRFQCKTISVTTPQQFPNTLLQCFFTSIEFASGEFDTSLKLYSSGCMVVIHCQFQLA